VTEAAPLIVLTGPPGAGKSSVARGVAAAFERSVLVDGDAFFAFLASGAIAPWLEEAGEQNGTVIEAAAAAAGRYAVGGYVTVYDGIVGPWYLPDFVRATGLAQLHYLVLLPSLEVCRRRVLGRTGHPFRDEAAADHMHRQFAQATVAPGHLLAPPPDDLDGVVASVLGAVAAGGARFPA
jgi:AAA domain